MIPRLLAYGVAATVFLIDRVSKGMINNRVMPWDIYAIIPGFFNIVHTENRGAVFGWLSGVESGWRSFLLLGLSLVVLFLAAFALWHPGGDTARGNWFRLGLALVLGGAAGNLYDRMAHGTVTDFLDFYIGSYHWPAFNVADSAITIGAALLLVDLWLNRRIKGTT
jgi:signal peptidase II